MIRNFSSGSKSMITVYVYGKCSNCKQALLFLEKKKISFEKKEITETPPSLSELRAMVEYLSSDVRKLFNTSGILYREMELAKKLPALSLEEAFALLRSNGMLVKRPFLLGSDFGFVGFSEKMWEAKL